MQIAAGAIVTLAIMPACAQKANTQKLLDKTITASTTTSLLSTLSADDMGGRKIGTPGIQKAAAVIANEFKKAGLKPLSKDSGYYQNFTLVNSQITQKSIEVNSITLPDSLSAIISTQAKIAASDKKGYEILTPKDQQEIYKMLMSRRNPKNNALVVLPSRFQRLLKLASRLQSNQISSPYNTIIICLDEPVESFDVQAENQLQITHLANIVGILPGKTKPDEIVIFSGHYDHLGIDPQNPEDSIYNGANDDASGTTAVMQLAKYYTKLGGNARTLVFAAFTGEEEGGFGSTYFSKQFDPQKVMAMFNIEMIGTQSKWGENSAYITGYEKTNMGEILQKNLKGTGFTFYPDPYTDQHLFYRSDNATLARLGVPAHTISTSKMDAEPNYHKVSDEISTLDLPNMNRIIRCIALSARSIVQGEDTPSRVNTAELD
ncbi:Peptidase family M28 [Arachidicoccus rhizosphaerae]|uniref:Peptidase family M28 n=2 Tax=Arachidicoccus rhizosphaerae TaxID=551991 RepID=A0A1H4B823_9BACT|nr:Peptidase family M28 [Arachidicoccus rhizosphaerae]